LSGQGIFGVEDGRILVDHDLIFNAAALAIGRGPAEGGGQPATMALPVVLLRERPTMV